MSQFFSASVFELRHNKCKKIIEELENLEKKFSLKLKLKELTYSPEDSNTNFYNARTISPHFINKHFKKNEFPTLNSNLEEIIPKYFDESEKFEDNNLKTPLHLKENNLLHCFDKLKFIFSELAHVIHYNSIPFELKNYLNPENEIAYCTFFRPRHESSKFFHNMVPSVEFSTNLLSFES